MPTFERGDVVRVPFPYTDRNTRQHRPAVVVSRGALGGDAALLWVLMITSASNRRWPGDVSLVRRHEDAGLPVPSLIRTTKIATIDAGRADPLGTLPAHLFTQVEAMLRRHLGLAPGGG